MVKKGVCTLVSKRINDDKFMLMVMKSGTKDEGWWKVYNVLV